MKKNISTPCLVLIACSSFLATGCTLPFGIGGSSSSTSSGTTSSDDSSSSGDSSSGGGGSSGSGGSSTPTYGISCANRSNGADKIAGSTGDTSGETPAPYIVVTSTSGLTGSTINTVKIDLYYTDNTDQQGFASPVVSSVSMDAYQCVPTGGPLGSSVASANMTSNTVKNTSNQETFNFNGGLTIPTNCPSGTYPLVFKINYGGGYILWGSSGGVSSGSTCYLPASTNGLTRNPRSYSLDISANQ